MNCYGEFIQGSNRSSRILSAIKNDNINALEELLATGCDTNILLTGMGNSPLYCALKANSQACAILLLERKAKIFHLHKRAKTTPLCLAAKFGNERVVDWLLANGSKANQTNSKGETPLHLAATGKIATMLLAGGRAKLDAQCGGEKPIHRALAYRRPEVVTSLVAHGANVNEQDKNGDTLLHLLIRSTIGAHPLDVETKADIEMFEVLIGNGANVDAKTGDGSTVLHLLDHVDHLAEAILTTDVDIDAQNNLGQTPLHTAKDPELVERYLSQGASVSIRCCRGKTALESVFENYCKFTDEGPDHLEPWTQSKVWLSMMINLKMRYLVQHIVKLKVIGINNLESLSPIQDRINVNGLLDYSKDECRLELDQLEENVCKLIKDNLTTRYPYYVTNKQLCDKLLREINAHEYPIYGELILNKLARDKRRLGRLEQCKQLFSSYSKLKPSLPGEVWSRILSTLSDIDLVVLVRKLNTLETSSLKKLSLE